MKKLQSLKASKLSKFENKKIENLNTVVGGGVTGPGKVWDVDFCADCETIHADGSKSITYLYCDC